jgi:hypothetical protein
VMIVMLLQEENVLIVAAPITVNNLWLPRKNRILTAIAHLGHSKVWQFYFAPCFFRRNLVWLVYA